MGGAAGCGGAVQSPGDIQTILAALARENSSMTAEIEPGAGGGSSAGGAARSVRDGGGGLVKGFPRMPSAKKITGVGGNGGERGGAGERAALLLPALDDGRTAPRPVALHDFEAAAAEKGPGVPLGVGGVSFAKSSRRYSEVEASVEGCGQARVQDEDESEGGGAGAASEAGSAHRAAPNELTIEVGPRACIHGVPTVHIGSRVCM